MVHIDWLSRPLILKAMGSIRAGFARKSSQAVQPSLAFRAKRQVAHGPIAWRNRTAGITSTASA
jgi:hypothetical protein